MCTFQAVCDVSIFLEQELICTGRLLNRNHWDTMEDADLFQEGRYIHADKMKWALTENLYISHMYFKVNIQNGTCIIPHGRFESIRFINSMLYN